MSSSLSALLVALTLSDSADDGRLVCAFAGDIQGMCLRGGNAAQLVACLKNIIAFQIYGVILVVLTVIATMPYGLGLFVLVPTLFASIYASYQDIFCDRPESA